jgi:hypothetical protein
MGLLGDPKNIHKLRKQRGREDMVKKNTHEKEKMWKRENW